MSLEAVVAALHQPLLRFAKLQLRNDSMAEDVVSETLLALLETPDRFERSQLAAHLCHGHAQVQDHRRTAPAPAHATARIP